MKKVKFPAAPDVDLRRILDALRREAFDVVNVGRDARSLVVFLHDEETRDPSHIVQWFLREHERISGSPTINIVTAVSRPDHIPAIYQSMLESVTGTDAKVRWLLVFDAPGPESDELFRIIRDCSRIKVEKVIYMGGPVKFGILQKNLGMDSIVEGFYHCLDDDNLVHPEFFSGITRAIAANPGKKAFAFHQQRWDGHGDLWASAENMKPCLVDNTMFVVHKDLIGEDRYDLEKAGLEDFYFFKKLYDKDPDAFVFVDQVLAYYNYLNCIPEQAYSNRLVSAMVTIPRQEGYIRDTLNSLSESKFFLYQRDLPLRLVAGWPDTSHVDHLRRKPTKFRIHPFHQGEAERYGFDGLDKKQRCAFGHFRAMNELLEIEGAWDTALIFEDDVRFSKGWRLYLDRLVSEIRKVYGEKWMLTLYRIDHAHQKGALAEFEKGNRYFEPDGSAPFWGTQAIVYPRETLKLMPESLLEGCIKRFKEPVDITLGEFAKAKQIPILVSVPSLVQHIGGNTTGQSDWFHQAECWRESVEDLCG